LHNQVYQPFNAENILTLNRCWLANTPTPSVSTAAFKTLQFCHHLYFQPFKWYQDCWDYHEHWGS